MTGDWAGGVIVAKATKIWAGIQHQVAASTGMKSSISNKLDTTRTYLCSVTFAFFEVPACSDISPHQLTTLGSAHQ